MKRFICLTIFLLLSNFEAHVVASCKLAYTAHLENLYDSRSSLQVAMGTAASAGYLYLGKTIGTFPLSLAIFTTSIGVFTALPMAYGDFFINDWRNADLFLDYVRTAANKIDYQSQLMKYNPKVFLKLKEDVASFKAETQFLASGYSISSQAREYLRTRYFQWSSSLSPEERAGFRWITYYKILVLNELDKEEAFCTNGLDSIEQMFKRADDRILNHEIRVNIPQ